MNDVTFNNVQTDTKYLKPDKTFIPMNSKDENTVIVNIIDVKDKKTMLKKNFVIKCIQLVVKVFMIIIIE